MTIAVTGATGQLGRLVIAELKNKAAGEPIIALVRSPEKAKDLGVEARKADYEDPASLEAALKGVNKLLLISGSEVGKRTVQHGNVIAAAKNNGVSFIAYTSLLHADKSSLVLAPEHIATEKMLAESGIPYTLLRNGWYFENYAASIKPAVQAGALIGSAGDAKIAAATRADYAKAAVAVITGTGHENKIYELASDTPFTLADLAAEISRQTGKTIAYVNMSTPEHEKALVAAGFPEQVAAMFAGFDTGAAKGDLFDDSKTLSKLTGQPTTPLAESVAAALKA